MSEKPRVAVIDDNTPQRTILTRLLDQEYQVSAFASGEAFLDSKESVEIILLDIEMPGLNGYDTCRALRSRAGGNEVSVIFVSAHDEAADRVAAYQAGGDDFVIKPIAAHELRYKLSSITQHRQQLNSLAAQSSSDRQATLQAMSRMDDLAVVIAFLRKSASSQTYQAIAEQLTDAMQAWGLRGAVRVHGRTGLYDCTTAGNLSPLQTSVFDTMRDIGRNFEFGSRAILNYSHVSVLIENLPVRDADKVCRLRDHLAVLAENTDLRIDSLDTLNERDMQHLGIEGALAELRGALARLSENTHGNRTQGQNRLLESLEDLSRTLNSMGLTENQKHYVDDLLKAALDETRHYFDQAADHEMEFSEVLNRLERLSLLDYRL